MSQEQIPGGPRQFTPSPPVHRADRHSAPSCHLAALSSSLHSFEIQQEQHPEQARQRISIVQSMSVSQKAVQMAMLRKRHSLVQDFYRGCCLAHHLGLPRKAVLLLVDQQKYHQLPRVSWVQVSPTHTDQHLDPKQPMLFGSPEHRMSLTGTLGWLPA